MVWANRFRVSFCVVLSFLAASPVRASEEVEQFCTMELVPAMKVAMAERSEARKDRLLHAHRDRVLAGLPAVKFSEAKQVLVEATGLPRVEYQNFLREYFRGLEAKVEWGDGKRVLASLMHDVIASQAGAVETKSDLRARVDEDSIVSFSAFLPLLEKMSDRDFRAQRQILAGACGGDGLAPGGIAFPLGSRKVFAFCPGAVLRASVVESSDGVKWASTVSVDGLLFTAFHEFGHLLGADRFSSLRPLHSGLVTCLNSRMVPFGENYTDEVLADFWGSVALVHAMDRRGLSDEAAMDLMAVNLSPFRNGSMGSPHHLPYGSRQQVVLAEVCRYLRREKLGNRDCRLRLGEEEGYLPGRPNPDDAESTLAQWSGEN